MQPETNIYDAMIVGAGPAGASCAVWLARLGFAPMVLEAAGQVGGLCRTHPFRDDWNAALPGMTGPEVADNMALSLAQAQVPVRLSHKVESVAAVAGGFRVAAAGPSGRVVVHGRHLVLASGVTARKLPGLEAGGAQAPSPASASLDAGRRPFHAGEGVLVGPGGHIVAHDFRGQRVAVLGGGDNAFENALYAMGHGAGSVDIHARRVRAQHQFVDRFPPERLHVGDYRVDAAARTVNGRPYDVLMVFYGWEPRLDFAEGLDLRRTPAGYVEVDAATAQTSCPGVYAVGEVTQRMHPCVVTALADGVIAAKAIQARLESRAA